MSQRTLGYGLYMKCALPSCMNLPQNTRRYLLDTADLFFPCLWNLSPINAREITKNDNNKSRKKILIQCTIFRMLLNCVVYPPRIKLPQNKPQIISTPEQTDTGRQLSLQPSAFVTKQIQILVQIQKQIWICMKIPIVPNKKIQNKPWTLSFTANLPLGQHLHIQGMPCIFSKSFPPTMIVCKWFFQRRVSKKNIIFLGCRGGVCGRA